MIAEGELSEGQVRPLISWDPNFVLKLVPRIVAEEWSARKVEQYLVNAKRQGTATADQTPAKTPDAGFESRITSLTKRLKTPVDIRLNSRGAGKIVISFKDQAELERLQAILDREQ